MSIEDLIAEMDGRFSSSNSVPVTRARIDAEEWQALRDHIARLEVRLIDAEIALEAA